MEELNKANTSPSLSNEFDIKDMLLLTWKYKLFVSLITVFGAIFSIGYSLSLQNTYISYAKLLPVSEQSMSSQASQFSGLAALAGIQMDPSTKSNDAIERLQSFAFFNDEIYEGNERFSASLIAAESWNEESKQIKYNQKRATLRNIREKKWKAVRKKSTCKLKKGQTSKKIPLNAVYCYNCSKDAWKRGYQNYCMRKRKGKYVASCDSCVYST